MKYYKGFILTSLVFVFTLCYIALISAVITTTLNSPTNGFSNSLNTITFNCSANITLDSGYLTNISLYTNLTGSWANNQSNTSLSATRTNFTNTSVLSAGSLVFKLVKNISINEGKGGIIQSYTNKIWGTGGVVNQYSLVGFVYLNGSHTNTSSQSENSENVPVEHTWTGNFSEKYVSYIEVWIGLPDSGFYTNEGFDNISFYVNTITQTFPFNLTGNTLWNCLACDNNSVCSFSSANRTVNYNTIINSNTYNSQSYETSNENYTLNITPIGYTPTNAKLVYNNIEYSTTLTSSGSSYTINSSRLLTSSLIGSNTFYYKWNTSSTTELYSSNYTQTVSPIQFGLCNATLTVPYLNISFKDEDDNSIIAGTVSSSTFNYYIGNGTNYRTYTYSTSSNYSNYTFCTLPANKTYYIDIDLQYKLGSVYDALYYPQRNWNPEVSTYTNSTTNQTLYLLSSEDGQDVTFQVLNVAGQTIDGVSVEAYRVSGSSQVFVASGTTGGSGSLTFFLNKNYVHIINFTKTGYTQYTFNEAPTQTTYTITMGSSASSAEDYRQGIRLSKTPINSSVEENSVTDFTFTITSDKYTLVNFTATLYFGNGTLIGSDSSTTGTGGTITFSNVNVTNQSIYMYYNWSINTSTLNGVYYWINSGTEGREFSIWNFFKDFNDYTSESNGGLLGLDNFGRGLLAVIFIVLVVGTMGYRYGIQSEPMVLGMIFGIVLFLDTMNFIPKPDILGIAPLDNFLTIITALILIGFVIREEMR